MMTADTQIRVFIADEFRLELYDENIYSGGRRRLSYRLYDNDKLIFEGQDFGISPLHSDDSNHAVAELLHFLSLREGDTDAEYFADYTPEQIEWRNSDRSELLQMVAYDLEESETESLHHTDISDESPTEDDYLTSDGRNWYQYGKLVVMGDRTAVKSHMEATGFYPDAFAIDRNGNAERIEI